MPLLVSRALSVFLRENILLRVSANRSALLSLWWRVQEFAVQIFRRHPRHSATLASHGLCEQQRGVPRHLWLRIHISQLQGGLCRSLRRGPAHDFDERLSEP